MPARTFSLAAATALCGVFVASSLLVGRAQPGEPIAATIHQGTCEEVGGTVFVLNEVASTAPAEDAELAGVGSAIPVLASATSLNSPLDLVLGSPHALVLSSSEEEAPIACGGIGGMVSESDVFFGIAERNDSGYAGIGSLRSPEEGQTVVTVLVAQGLGGAGDAALATPGAATPVSEAETSAEDAEATEVTVEMVDIDFNPNETTIPANTDVTVRLPNLGETVHNFYIDALDIQTEDVEPGGETTVTINAEPGEFEYYCDIPGHRAAGMVGTLIVE